MSPQCLFVFMGADSWPLPLACCRRKGWHPVYDWVSPKKLEFGKDYTLRTNLSAKVLGKL